MHDITHVELYSMKLTMNLLYKLSIIDMHMGMDAYASTLKYSFYLTNKYNLSLIKDKQ